MEIVEKEPAATAATGEEKPKKPVAIKPAARNKLGILAKQVRDHAKKHGLEVFVMHAGEKLGGVMITGHYSANLVRNVVAHMSTTHPEIYMDVNLMLYMAAQHPTLFMNVATAISNMDNSGGVDAAPDGVDPSLEAVGGEDEVVDPALGQEPES